MFVRDIWNECVEATGTADEKTVLAAITRGVELLANKGLYDPLIGYLDFRVDNGYFVSLPADVKTPLRININNNPAFSRAKLFEFSQNTDGTVTGPEVTWAWSDKGYSPIQDNTKLPAKVSYDCDVTSTVTLIGQDEEDPDHRIVKETITSGNTTSHTFRTIDRVIRDKSTNEGKLTVTVVDPKLGPQVLVIARYYPWEEDPNYRVIKLSQTGVAIRMMYRKHVFKLSSQDDIIQLNSGMAVVQATRAVRFMLLSQYLEYQQAIGVAEGILNEEQGAIDQNVTLVNDVLDAVSFNIFTRDSIIVADIYDEAASIFGPIGRMNVFDKMTTAIEVLANKAQWDSLLGYVDVWRSDSLEVNPRGSTSGNGYFVLPRYVNAILAIDIDGRPSEPLNSWFEFHLNGTGERYTSPVHKWVDMGEVVTVNHIPLDPLTRKPIPQKVVAVPDSRADNGTLITIWGEDENGREVKVVPPCIEGSWDPDETQPILSRITRITKAASTGCIRLVTATNPAVLLGYWYPEEVEPKYRAITLPTIKAARIRMKYRKRTARVASLYDPVELRSRLAITDMLRALKARESNDIQTSQAFEATAVNYLREELVASSPIQSFSLQIDESTSAPFSGNIQ